MSDAVSSQSTAPDYPLFLSLTGREVLVVGGGPVAERRTATLLQAQAQVTLVTPWATEALQEWAAAGELIWQQREFEATDLVDVWLVHACTGDHAVDVEIATLADQQRIWCVRASDASASSAWSAASDHTVDGIQVAVNAGRDPKRAKLLRNAVAELSAEAGLPIRRQRPATGKVYLVGGGPGDPDLLTVRARRLLSLADVVVTDRLAPVHALDQLAPDVSIIDVGKAPGRHALPQPDINELLVEQATAGKVVVRLKGGDPFVLGRGGEEALHCLQAGVDVEVVPGVTSAISVPAAAGIPVTHRGLSDSFLVLSAHNGAAEVIRRAGCTPVDTTLVLLMGVRHLDQITAALVAHGRDPDTPVSVTAEGWTSEQESVTGSLADIAGIAAAAEISSPAVVVVGAVAGLRDQLGDLAQASIDAGHGAIS